MPAEEAPATEKPMGWAKSLGLILLGIIVCFLASSLLTLTAYPRFWIAGGDALGLPAQLTSVVFFIRAAINEEISKAFGAWSTRPRANKLSWWASTTLVGASFGIVERILMVMNWTPEFQAQFTPLTAITLDTIAVVSHTALTLLSVSIALAIRGGWRGWILGVLTAGALHAAHNLLPRFIDLGWTYAWTALSATIMVIILVTTFILRDRIQGQTRLKAP